MPRHRVESAAYESRDEYRKVWQKEKYKNNPEYMAQNKLKYYKKIYKENERFQDIIKQNKTNVELLLEVVTFHHKIKLGI